MEIREIDFEEIVLKSDRPVLVDFWASWCPPCKMMQPVVDRMATKVGDWADVYSVNIDRCPSLAGQYEVSGVPTFIAFADGKPVDRRTGALTEGQMMTLLRKAEESMPVNVPRHSVAGSDAIESALNMRQTVQPTEKEESRHGVSRHIERPWITIVSGLPRSGTSMMMRMLESGGIPALTDELRTPDEDNPNGYYEFEDVKSIENYTTWIDRAPGHSVKMVYSLLEHLPTNLNYRIVFMRRDVDEILQSQKAMLERNGIETDVPDKTMKTLFDRQLRQFYAWLPSQTHLKLINVSYNELLSRPESVIAQINHHFDESLDTDAMKAMIDQNLYRHRAA